MPIDSLIRFRSTGRVADMYISDYFLRKLRGNLCRFVTNVDHFLHELHITSSVISGSFALAILFRLAWTPKDLDVYTPRDLFWHVVAFLVRVEGYTVSFISNSDYSVFQNVHSVARLRRPNGGRIDVVQSETNSPLLPLASFWNTAVMNYITPTSFCIAYPHLTDAHRALMTSLDIDIFDGYVGRVPFPREGLLLLWKYERRGFSLRFLATSWDREEDPLSQCPGVGSTCCPLTMRSFGDKHCVTGSFYPVQGGGPLPPRPARRNFVEELTAVWWWGGQTCGDGCGQAGEWVYGDTYSCVRSLLK
ncbi:hypothetical protein C2E23DRAFT_871376 [Lenzites betulinus]|nr:hypothetical protein C2E23DRAFT_871376 [Lenzites betulinus]